MQLASDVLTRLAYWDTVRGDRHEERALEFRDRHRLPVRGCGLCHVTCLCLWLQLQPPVPLTCSFTLWFSDA